MTAPVSTALLVENMQDARNRTLELVRDLDDEQLMGPQLPMVNPLLWEIAHVAYFYEYFILRQLYGYESVLGERADQLYDSISIDHDVRWDLPLLTRAETLSYLQAVLDRLAERLDSGMATEQDSTRKPSFWPARPWPIRRPPWPSPGMSRPSGQRVPIRDGPKSRAVSSF